MLYKGRFWGWEGHAKVLLGYDQNWLSCAKPCPQKEGFDGSLLTSGFRFLPL